MTLVIRNKLFKALFVDRPISIITCIKLTIGLAILVSLLSHSRFDPSPFNLLRSTAGTFNWLGLPGALSAGLLFDFFGLASFLIPIQLVLFTRIDSVLQPKHLFPDLLEIFVLVSLLALIASSFGRTVGTRESGIWGVVTVEGLSKFPGAFSAILLFMAYQLIYFSRVRLDPSFFIIIGAAILLVIGILNRLAGRIITIIKKSAKYSSINWWSPLTLLVVSLYKKNRLKLINKYQQTKQELDGANLVNKVSSSMDTVWGRKGGSDRILTAYSSGQMGYEEKMLSKVIKKYRKLCYAVDSKAFLKLEEEI